MTTMHEEYGEPNDKFGKHLVCDECGMCIECGDCKKYHNEILKGRHKTAQGG